MKKFLLSIHIIIALVLAGCGLFLSPLPKDEELIAYFYAHRSDLEELVKRDRQYVPEQRGMHHLWMKQGDTPQLLQRAGVERLSETVYIWIPDSYAPDFLSRRNALRDERWDLFYSRYSALEIHLNDVRYFSSPFFKTLLHFPEVPRVKENLLITPGEDEKKQLEKRYPDHVVYPSLNNHLPQKGYCALRQIEPQWFINVCHF